MLRDTVLLKFMAILLCARLVMSPTDSATVLEGGIGARGLGRLWRKKGTKVEVEVEGEGEGEGMMAQVGRRDRAMSRVNLVMGQASSVSSGSNKSSVKHDRRAHSTTPPSPNFDHNHQRSASNW